MDDICNFIPPKSYDSELCFVHFVYEANIKRLKQPFVRPNFYINIVFKGTALLKYDNKRISLESGDIFFTFPGQSFFIDADDKFTFLYISFNGSGAGALLDSLDINKENCISKDHSDLLDFWMDSIKRLNDNNANMIAESVLMHTLSFIGNANTNAVRSKDKLESVLEYIRHNYTSKDMSVKKVADIFFYSEKYFSSLFSKKTGVKFSQYLNDLRVKHAKNLLAGGNTNISEIADKCGYADQFYFSKVFKKITDMSPSEYIKSILKE